MNAILRELELRDEKSWRRLLHQLKPERDPKVNIEDLISDPNFFGVVAQHRNQVIGFGSISFFQSSLKGVAGAIEDVIVDEVFQGHKVGSKILDALISEAEKRNANCMVLTSSAARVGAVALYESRGFVLYETGFFTKNL